MKRLRQFSLIFILLLFCFASAAQAGSPVWEISKDGSRLYIGGTIHFLTPDDYPLPTAFEKAYAKASSIVFETDLEKVQSLEFQQSVLEKGIYPGEETVLRYLQPDTQKTLTAFLEERGIPLALLSKMKPGILSVTLTSLELQRLNLIGTGVDQHFYGKAVQDRLDIVHLETPDEQLSFLVNMGLGRENDLISYTLTDLKNLSEMYEALKAAWHKGEMDRIFDLSLKTMATRFPDIYRSIVVNRNMAWLPRIEAMLQTPEVEFVLVGAAHLAGEDGLIVQLQSKAYKVREM